MKPAIQSIGTAVPKHKIPQAHHLSILQAANGMDRREQLVQRQIYSKSGIEYRYSVLGEFGAEDKEENQLFHPSGMYPVTKVAERMNIYEQHAAALCKQAALDCFSRLPNFNATAVTHLITFSCTGMYAPGLDIQLVELLGLKRSVQRTCINFMGCYAAINALKAAYYIAKAEPEAVVLIAGVELCTLHFQTSNDPNQVVANALFGDGAAAAIISSKHITGEDQLSLMLKGFYAEFEQSAADEMVWRIGNEGFDLRLTPEVPLVVKNNIKALLDKLFEANNISQTDIDYYALHPGGMKILEACEQALHIDKEANRISYSILNDYGNMSSVTILFVLKRYLATFTEVDKGKKVLACAFGPGITMESMIAEIQ